MAEPNPATALKKARAVRTTAEAELRTARKELKRIEKELRASEAERDRVRKRRHEKEAALRRLEGELEARRREEQATDAQVRQRKEQIAAIRGAEGRRDELVWAESRLAALNVQLDQLQNKIAGLKILSRQARDKQTEIDGELQKLKDEIAEKNKIKRSTNNEIVRKEQHLDDVLRPYVAKEVGNVRVETVRVPLTDLKDWIKQQKYLLQVFGGAGLVYAYTLLAGASHEWWLYYSNDLRISHYTVLSDFLLMWPVLWGVLLTPVVIFLARRLLSIPPVSEHVARGLCLLVGRPVWRGYIIGLGMVILSLIGPCAVGSWKYNSVFPTPENNKNLVTVLTAPSLPDAEKLVLIGSNSTWMFFKKARDDASIVKAVPLTRIVCVGRDACAAQATKSSDGSVSPNPDIPEESGAPSELLDMLRGTLEAVQRIARQRDPGGVWTPFEAAVVAALGEIGEKVATLPSDGPADSSDYIAEPLLPQFIRGQMDCGKDGAPIVSDLIRFVHKEPRSRCPECPSDAAPAAGSVDGSALDDAKNEFYRKKIEPKVERIVTEFSNRSATDWTVFGFASPDGEERENDTISRERARRVIDEMCRLRATGTPEPAIDCGDEETRYADTQVRYFGEWHPINGIANSRSAVIAACVPKTNR